MYATQQHHVQTQSQTISLNMIQACSVLSMSLEELSAYIQDAATANPLISFESIPGFSPGGDAGQPELLRRASIDFADGLDSSQSVFSTGVSGWQSLVLQIPPRISQRKALILRYLINSLDPDGYFRESVQELSVLLGCGIGEIEECISIIQRMEPAGIAARDLRECLLLQLERDPAADKLALLIVRDYFHELTKNQLKVIARAARRELAQINAAIDSIRRLNCRPGAELSGGSVRYIIPDVTIGKAEDNFTIALNRDFPLEIQLDESYMDSFRSLSDTETLSWLKDRKRQASLLQFFINKRNSTLLLVCGEIFQAQKPFFFKGPEYLRPLRQRDIAQALSCHESTVFRAVKDKYLSCAWGTFPLSYFFSNLLECEEDTMACNPKQLIRALIDSEEKSAPLPDSAIAHELSSRGIQISRRTVAKYRGEAGIPSASLRRAYI